MTLKEIYAKLQTLNIPIAYDHFETAQIPPFCIYITSDNLSGADYKNMLRRRAVRIEFYSTIKDEDSETAIEKLFNEYEMSKETIWVAAEKMFETIFEFEIYMKG